MTARRARRLGWLAFALTLACIPLTALMLSQHLRAFLAAESIWSTVVVFVGAVAFSVTGALIVSQHPHHAIGWTFVLSGLATAGAVVLAAYGELALAPGWTLPAGGIAQDVSHLLIQGGIFLPLTLGLLLFPDGHLLSPRWWIAAAAAVFGLVLRLIGDAVSDPNSAAPDLGDVGVLLTVGSALAGLAALALRWRRGGSVLKQQVAAGIAILRYGLYSIDFIINQAIVYIVFTAILAGLYAGITATLQRVFVAVTGQSSEAAIVITVALIATLFTPVRNALQRLVDRRFKDARSLERLMESLETEVGAVVDVMDGQRLAERLVKTAREGADAIGAALFLDGETRPSYVSGDWNGEAALVVPLRAGDHEVGRIALGARRRGAPYLERERERLQRAADVVAVGLTLGRQRRQVELVAH